MEQSYQEMIIENTTCVYQRLETDFPVQSVFF